MREASSCRTSNRYGLLRLFRMNHRFRFMLIFHHWSLNGIENVLCDMQDSVTIPDWLDTLLFQQMDAKYCCSNADMTVIDWSKADMANYLGTYFPRSYAESFCIFDNILKSNSNLLNGKEELSIFDFGCGTGGEIIGLIMALSKYINKLKILNIKGLDGNFHALRMLETIINETNKHVAFHINFKESALRIDDLYDMKIINSIFHGKYDIIMSFKAICEFVTKKQFEERNPYQYLPTIFQKRLNENGVIILDDVTTYNNTSQEWLPIMMDKGLKESNCKIKNKNEGYNQCFLVTHSHKKNDKSKVAWRVIFRQ